MNMELLDAVLQQRERRLNIVHRERYERIHKESVKAAMAYWKGKIQ